MKVINNTIEQKKFAFVIGCLIIVVFVLILPARHKTTLPLWPWFVAFSIWLTAILWPRVLSPIYEIWMKIGSVLGWINTRIILTIIFLTILTPVALVMRLLKRDVLNKKFDKNSETYRKTVKSTSIKKMEVPY